MKQKKLQDSKINVLSGYLEESSFSCLHPSISSSFQSCNKLPSLFLVQRNGISLSPFYCRYCSLLFSGISPCVAGRYKDREIRHCCRLLPAEWVQMHLVTNSLLQRSHLAQNKHPGHSKKAAFLPAARPQPYS